MQVEYRPPDAQLAEPVRFGTRSSVAAVLLGGLGVDFLGTLVASLLMAIAWGTVVTLRGGDAGQVEASLNSIAFLASASGVGGLLSLAGGYVAANWARRRSTTHGVAAGVLSLVLSLPFFLVPGATVPLWLTVAGLVLHLPLAASGGYIAGRRFA